jgi:hypothetical protein
LALGAVGVGLRDQFFGDYRVFYRLADLPAQEFGADLVGLLVERACPGSWLARS